MARPPAPERPPAGRRAATGVPDRAGAREERTGLGGAGVALGWADPAGRWVVAGRRPAPLGAQRRNANRPLCRARAVLTAAEAKTRRCGPARRVLACWATS